MSRLRYTFHLTLCFIENQLFPKIFYLKNSQELKTIPVMIDHPISLTAVYFSSLRASHCVCLTETGEKPRTVPCSDVPFFILLAFRYFMALIESKIHRKTGSHNESKSTQPC